MARPHLRDPKLEQFWRTKLTKWVASGLNIRDFCRLHRLHEPSFYHWRREIAARDGTPIAQPTTPPKPISTTRRSPAATPRKRPTSPAPRRSSTPTPRPSFVTLRVVADTPLELVLRTGHVLRIPPGYDARHLHAVVTALAAPSC